MTRDRNYLSEGYASISDTDLLNMHDMMSVLPWLQPVLEELQFLRDAEHEVPEHLLMDESLPDDVEALKALLTKIGAKYDGSDD